MKLLAVLLALAMPATAQTVGPIKWDTPSDITFVSHGEPVLVIHSDGRITAGKNAKPDEAARAILKALETMLRSRECAK